MATRKHDPGWAVTDESAYEFLRLGPADEVYEAFFHVKLRTKVGKVVPFVQNPNQKNIDAFLERALAIELRMQVDAVRGGEESYIDNLLERVDPALEAGMTYRDMVANSVIEQHEIGIKVLNGKSRRAGSTTKWSHVGYRRSICLDNYSCLQMAHNQETATELFELPRQTHDRWPSRWANLRPPGQYDNNRQFRFRNKSGFSIRTAGSRRRNNEKTRGWEFDFYHFSEYAHYETFSDVAQIEGVRPPHAWVVKESTANGKQGPFYVEWQNALTVEEVERAYEDKDYDTLTNWNGYYTYFFSWLEDPTLVSPLRPGESLHIKSTLDAYEVQLMSAFPDLCTLQKIKWRRERMAGMEHHEVLSDVQLFQQEYPSNPVEMFQSSGADVFDSAALDVLELKAREMDTTGGPAIIARLYGESMPQGAVRGGANFYCYHPPQRGHEYVIGADVALGIGKDHSVAVVLDRCDGTFFREVACFRSNLVDPKQFGHVITTLAEWYNRAFVCCEALGGGQSTNKAIVEDNKYFKIYHREVIDMVGAHRDGGAFRYGFWTSQQFKLTLANDARPIIRDRRCELRTLIGIQELRSFQEEDGKFGAPEGEHDDFAMAFCLAVWAGLRQCSSLNRRQKGIIGTLAQAEAELDTNDQALWKMVMKHLDQEGRRNTRTRPRDLFPSADGNR